MNILCLECGSLSYQPKSQYCFNCHASELLDTDSLQSLVGDQLVPIGKDVRLNEIISEQLGKIGDKINLCSVEEAKSIRLESMHIVFVPFVEIQYSCNIAYRYTAVYKQRVPFTDYVSRKDASGRLQQTPVTRYRTDKSFRDINGKRNHCGMIRSPLNKLIDDGSAGYSLISPGNIGYTQSYCASYSDIDKLLQSFDSMDLVVTASVMDVDMTASALLADRIDSEVSNVFTEIKKSDCQGDQSINYQITNCNSFLEDETNAFYIPFLISSYSSRFSENKYYYGANIGEQSGSIELGTVGSFKKVLGEQKIFYLVPLFIIVLLYLLVSAILGILYVSFDSIGPLEFLASGRYGLYFPMSSGFFLFAIGCSGIYGIVRYFSLRRSHIMKIRGTIGGLISSVSAGDFSILLSSYSSSQDDEVSLARSDELEKPVIGLSSELSRLFPVVRKHFPLLIVLTVRAKKFLKHNKYVAEFIRSPFGNICASQLSQFIATSDDLDKKIFIASAGSIDRFFIALRIDCATIAYSLVLAAAGNIQLSYNDVFRSPNPISQNSNSRGNDSSNSSGLMPKSIKSAPVIGQREAPDLGGGATKPLSSAVDTKSSESRLETVRQRSSAVEEQETEISQDSNQPIPSEIDNRVSDSKRETANQLSSAVEEQETEVSQDLNQLIPSELDNIVSESVRDPLLTGGDNPLGYGDLPDLRSPFAISGYLVDSFVESLNTKCSSCLLRIFPSAPPQILSYLSLESTLSIGVDSINLSSANDDFIVVEASLRNLDSSKLSDLIFSIDPSSGKILHLEPLSVFASGF